MLVPKKSPMDHPSKVYRFFWPVIVMSLATFCHSNRSAGGTFGSNYISEKITGFKERHASGEQLE